ncbi:MAG: hypothetical protein HFI69_05365 [Lachnospiraceae bacterium]|nr:hypothetical protein [Lachnospiraceae bacterium]
MKKNKTYTIQARCTEEEVREIDKAASKCGMKRSDYIRTRVFHSGKGKSSSRENVSVAIAAQELLNYIEENCPFEDKVLGRKVDKIWKML